MILHLMQHSGHAFDSDAQAASDLDDAFATQPDALGGTEFSKRGHRDVFLAACRRHNYIAQGGEGDSVVAINRVHKFIRGGSRLACTGGSDEHGKYGPRYIDWATADMYDETVTVAASHWPRPKNQQRIEKHKAVTAVALKLITEKSAGTNLAFLLGDINADDNPNDTGRVARQFAAAGITSVWDELSYYPPTGPGGGTIDLVASANRDTRVSAAGVYVWPLGFSDHRRVSAFYSVRGVA